MIIQIFCFEKCCIYAVNCVQVLIVAFSKTPFMTLYSKRFMNALCIHMCDSIVIGNIFFNFFLKLNRMINKIDHTIDNIRIEIHAHYHEPV